MEGIEAVDTVYETIFSKVSGLSVVVACVVNDCSLNLQLTPCEHTPHFCDNGSSMTNGWGALAGQTCVTHDIQMCVNKFVKEPHVKDCSHAMQARSAHFSRSTLGATKLSEIQTQVGLPTNKPSTKSATRWLGLFPRAVWFVQ
jgi:hypothetical protein